MIRQRRVAIIGLWHETNTYGPHEATLERFSEYELVEGPALLDRHSGTRTVIGGFMSAGRDLGWRLVPIVSAGAWPSGPASLATIELLLGRLGGKLREVHTADPVDGVLVNLHGAMVAEGHPDVEAEVLGVIRGIVGTVPVGVVLDFHANPSLEFVRRCDAAVGYDTYPHVDMWERGAEVAELLEEALRGARLRTVVARLPLLLCPLSQGTETEPFRGFIARARLRQGPVARRVSVCGGFPYSDVSRAGVSALVVHTEGTEEAARLVAQQTIDDIGNHRDELDVPYETVSTAVDKVSNSPSAGATVLVDAGDNVGGGSAGDGTTLLAELLLRRVSGVIATVADPAVVTECQSAGTGGHVATLLGGKVDRLHGPPTYVRGRVERLTDGIYRVAGSWATGQSFSLGPSAVIATHDGTCRILVTTRAVPPFHGEQLSHAGIDARRAKVIVAKGAIAWRAAYGQVTDRAIVVDTPGACPIDISSLARRNHPVGVSWTASP